MTPAALLAWLQGPAVVDPDGAELVAEGGFLCTVVRDLRLAATPGMAGAMSMVDAEGYVVTQWKEGRGGIAMVVVGGKKVPAGPNDGKALPFSPVPEVKVGLTNAQLKWQF